MPVGEYKEFLLLDQLKWLRDTAQKLANHTGEVCYIVLEGDPNTAYKSSIPYVVVESMATAWEKHGKEKILPE